jgi:hypothetical protein
MPPRHLASRPQCLARSLGPIAAPEAPSPDLSRFWGDNVVMVWRYAWPPSFPQEDPGRGAYNALRSGLFPVRRRNRLDAAVKTWAPRQRAIVSSSSCTLANWLSRAVASSVEFGLTGLQPCRTALFSADSPRSGTQPAAPGQRITRDERAFGLCHTPRRGGRLVFDVIVREALGESPHQVTMRANKAERCAKLGGEPARYVEAVMRFSSIASRRN